MQAFYLSIEVPYPDFCQHSLQCVPLPLLLTDKCVPGKVGSTEMCVGGSSYPLVLSSVN